MRRLKFLAVACLALSVAVACSGSDDEANKPAPIVDAGPDPKIAECDETAYRAAVAACTGGFVGDVDPNARCSALEGGATAFTEGKYGEAACVAAEDGLVLKCVTEKLGTCEGKSPSQAALVWRDCRVQVDPTYKAASIECSGTCLDARITCEQACPSEGAAKECFDCFSQCGLKQQQCLDACPRQN